jgi:thiamine biosynthesis lipoprotein
MVTPIQHFSIHAMGGPCHLVFAALPSHDAEFIAEICFQEIRRIEQKYSRYRMDSVISKINQSAGKHALKIDAETHNLLEFAEQLFQQSDGLFDATAGILRRIWHFSSKQTLPSDAERTALLAKIGWDKIQRSSTKLYLPIEGMELDFGGFGKEYAADRIAATLSKHGVQSGYVNLAGDMRFLGPQPNGEPWSIGIQHPRQENKLIATIPIYVGALATSGDYERYVEIDGQRYCHILDPRTGMPVRFWRSVTVLAPLTTVAGACCTICMLKQDQGLAFLEASEFSYLAMDQLGNVSSHYLETLSHPSHSQ